MFMILKKLHRCGGGRDLRHNASGAAPAAQLIPLKVAYDGYSMTTAPMNYAVQKGIFRKYGLDVSLVYIDAGTTLSQAVVGGSVKIAQNGYSPAAAAAVQGADIVFIGGISNQLPFQLVVKPGINSAAALRGKKIAISRFGASSDVAATYALQSLGLKRGDVVLLQLGGEGTRTAAMLSGQIDGSFEQYPRTGELEEKGYHVLVDCLAIAIDYPNTSYVSTRAFREEESGYRKTVSDGYFRGHTRFQGRQGRRAEIHRDVPESRTRTRVCRKPMIRLRRKCIRTSLGHR